MGLSLGVDALLGDVLLEEARGGEGEVAVLLELNHAAWKYRSESGGVRRRSLYAWT